MIRFISQILAALLIFLVRVYQWTLSPLMHALAPGSGCRYEPTCSSYAIQALQKHGPLRGSWLAARRFGDCHPWGHHGYDPVPDRFPGWWVKRARWHEGEGQKEPPSPGCQCAQDSSQK